MTKSKQHMYTSCFSSCISFLSPLSLSPSLCFSLPLCVFVCVFMFVRDLFVFSCVFVCMHGFVFRRGRYHFHADVKDGEGDKCDEAVHFYQLAVDELRLVSENPPSHPTPPPFLLTDTGISVFFCARAWRFFIPLFASHVLPFYLNHIFLSRRRLFVLHGNRPL